MQTRKIAVIGLGQMGSALVEALSEEGAEVMAIDMNIERVEAIKDKATFAVRLDATDEDALRSQNVDEMDAVVVTIGRNFESLLLTVQALLSIGVADLRARAASAIHRSILTRMGVRKVIAPEEDAAINLSRHLVRPGLIGYLDISEDYQIAEFEAPRQLHSRTLAELDLIHQYSVTVVTIRRRNADGQASILGVPTAATTIQPGDWLIVLGKPGDIDRLLAQTK